MSMEHIDLSQISIYNTQRVTDEQSRMLYVARTKLLNDLLNSIVSTPKNAPPKHQLIIGQRGMGKTALLKRLEVEIRSQKEYEGFIPLLFPEEQYNLDSLTTFWLNCIDSLADIMEKEGEKGLAEEIDIEVERLSSLSSNERAKKVIEYFKHLVFNLGRRPVLLIDNINLVLARLTKEEQHALRAYLTENGAAIIIAASSSRIDDVHDYAAPFYDAFQVHYLRKLSGQELNEILMNLATATGRDELKTAIRKNSSRLKAINQLTGGNPRTAVILFKQIIDGFSEDIAAELEGILDAQTPLYKARFEELPEKMQIIVNAIAMQWDPVTLEQIRGITQMDNGQISPQLKRLSDFGWIDRPRSARGKGGSYEISERMFNIWFLMRRSSRRHKKMVACLSKFMEAFYERGSELSETLKKIMLKQFTDVKHAVTALALAKLVEDKETRWKLHEKTRQYIMEHPELSESFESKDLYDGAEEHAEALINAIQNDNAQAIILLAAPIYKSGPNELATILAHAYIETNQFSEAKKVINDVTQKDAKYMLLIDLAVSIHNYDSYHSPTIETCCQEAIACGDYNSDAYYFYTKYLVENERFDEALSVFKKAEKVFPEDPQLFGVAGEAYYYIGDNEKAESYLTSPVIKKEDEPGLINYYLGTIRYEQGRYSEAIEFLSKGKDSASPDAVLFNTWLIPALVMDGRVDESRDMFTAFMKMIDNPSGVANILSQLLSKEHRYDILLEYLHLMLTEWPNVSILKFYIADCYYFQDDFTEATKYIDSYLKDNPKDAKALFLRGLIAWQTDESYDLAKSCVQESLSIKETRTKYHTLGLIERGHNQYSAAATCFEKALSLEPRNVSSMLCLSELCEYHLKQTERAKLLAEEAYQIDFKEAPYRLVNLYRDGVLDYNRAEDFRKGIPENLHSPEWEAIHQILLYVHRGDWPSAKSSLHVFFDQFDTKNMDREIQCYLYAKCIEFGYGPDLLDFLEVIGIKESAGPEYYAIQSLLSDDPVVFFDSVAKEVREIGLSIARDIKYYIKEK